MGDVGNVTRMTATELARRIRARELSAIEVLRAHLDAIERVNAKINAICTLVPERALAEAAVIDARLARGETPGPLAGVPVGIKDVTDTSGIRTTYGSLRFADHVPQADDLVVTRLRAAGAVVIGKTNTPEFAAGANTVNRVFGATRNPWNLALSAAGSSGGAGAALAARILPLAQGTDYGGSVRLPAAFCGVVGLRPTPGVIPSVPSRLPFDSGSVHGPMARTVEDAALMLDAMAGFTPAAPLSVPLPWRSAYDEVSRAQNLAGRRIAFVPDITGIGVDPEIEAACRRAAERLASDGAIVEEISFDAAGGRDAYIALRGARMVAAYFADLDAPENLGPNLAGNVAAGLKVSTRELAAAEKARTALWHRFRALFEGYDLLVTPTVAVLPFPVEQSYPEEIAGRKLATYIDWVASTFLITLVALPAASVPAGLSKSGLPIGLQIVGPRFSEPRILAAAKFVEYGNPIGLPPNCA
ncbi:MAG: amidase family protein [Deltaproteobacteria bacterium]|nr:amidase family protein [Deltaproteobacteria bacterium]